MPSRADRDTTLQMIVLGAMVSGPGTVKEVQKRLADLWPGADISRNTAHTNLPLLVQRGYLRVIEEGEEPRESCDAMVDDGLAHLREWVSDWPSNPANREEIHVKTRFATLEELPEIVRMAKAQEEVSQRAGEKTQSKLLSDERLLAKLSPRDWEEEFEAEVRRVVLEDVTGGWEDLTARRKLFGEKVKEIYEKFSERLKEEGG